MTGENRQNSPFPAPDPLRVAEAATDGAVQDPFRIAAENMGELNRQAAIAAADRESTGEDPEPESNRTEQARQSNGHSDRETVRRWTGETVQTIL